MAKVKVCPDCEATNEEHASFCSRCDGDLLGLEPMEERLPASNEGALAGSANAMPEAETDAGLVCQHRQEPGGTCCVYCGENVYSGASTQPADGITLRWSWGMHTPVAGRIFIGRIPPVAEILALRLEQDYPNVSRLHAELSPAVGGLMVMDHSMNGTFLNGERIQPGKDVFAPVGATLRFASRLEATVMRETGGEI